MKHSRHDGAVCLQLDPRVASSNPAETMDV
jgi:hypothetical protein